MFKKQFLIMLCLFLSGCMKNADYTLKATTFDQIQHLRAGLRNDSLIIAVPVIVTPRKTGGVRSIVDFRSQIDITNVMSKKDLILPNGIIFMGRVRW